MNYTCINSTIAEKEQVIVSVSSDFIVVIVFTVTPFQKFLKLRVYCPRVIHLSLFEIFSLPVKPEWMYWPLAQTIELARLIDEEVLIDEIISPIRDDICKCLRFIQVISSTMVRASVEILAEILKIELFLCNGI